MKYVSCITIFAFIAILLVASPVAGSDGSGNRNAYIVISSLYSVLNSGSDFDTDYETGSYGIGIRLGGNISRHWGAELQVGMPGDMNHQYYIGESTHGIPTTISFYSMTANLRYRY